MKMSKILFKLPDFFLAQLLSFSSVLALTSSLGLTYPSAGTYLLILAATAAFVLVFANKLTAALSGILAGVAVLTAAYIVIFQTGFGKFAAFLDDYFYWLSDFIENTDSPNGFYQFITVLSLCIVFSMVTYLFTVKKFRFYILLAIGSAIFTIQWSYGLSTTLLPFFMFLPATLILYFKHVHKKKSAAVSNEYINTGLFTLWTLPVCLLVILIAALFHANDKPLEWKWLDKNLNSVYNYFNRKFDYEVFDYFSVSSSGFGSKDGVLGGRVKLNKTSVLTVDTPHNVYLRGSIKEIYTGTKWTTGSQGKQQIGDDFSSVYEDTDEMVSGMQYLTSDKDYLNKLFFRNQVSVTFLNLKTKSLFIPSKISELTPANKTTRFEMSAGGSLSATDRLTKGFKYTLLLYNPKVGSKDFENALRKSKRGLYNDILTTQAYTTTATLDTPDGAQEDSTTDDAQTYTATATFGTPDSAQKDGTADNTQTYTATVRFGTPDSTQKKPTAGSAQGESASDTTQAAANTGSAQETSNTGAAQGEAGVDGTQAVTTIDGSDLKAQLNSVVSGIKIIDYALIEKLGELNSRAESIEQNYVQLPENLPQRVRDLAISITNSSDNRYDKVKAIEKYLSDNFPYKLDVRTTPRNRDFVDYFLFDLKQGYCTYFASAMTVLARCAGIPARYVEGYILPPKPIKDGSNIYNVTNMQAHAWAEVYFEGYGWLPFEATSPFRSSFYADSTITSSISEDYGSAYTDYMEMIRKYGQGHDYSELDLGPVKAVKKTNYVLIIFIGLGAFMLIFASVILINLFRSKLRLFRILSLPPKECILKLYEYYVRILTLQGLGLLGGETPFQFSERIDRKMFFDPVKFKAVTKIFVRCRYSPSESNEQEKQVVSEFTDQFLRETKGNLGKGRFFLLKCVLGKI